jgi:hypothetical protein
MKRGPRSDRALKAAFAVAQMRGEVMFFERRQGTCFDFMTTGLLGTSAVRVERALRIHGSLVEIAAANADTITRIGATALAPDISRELWLWSPWGTMRYFRIEGAVINELDLFGRVRAPLVKGARAASLQPRWKKSRKKSVSPALQTFGPGQDPGAGISLTPDGGTVPVPAPGSNNGPEPAPVRYLRRRAAELKRKKEMTESLSMGKPDSGSPGGVAPGGIGDPPS